MSDTPDYVEKFVRFLHDANWHKSLLDIITDFIEGHRYTVSEIDSLIMSVTKKVETSLLDAVVRHQGSSVPVQRSYGTKLLKYAVKSGLIQSPEEPVYSLLNWIIKEPRNTSHHEFVSYPYNTLVLFMSEANQAIEQIEHLIEDPYEAYFRMAYEEDEKKIKIENAKVLRPNGSTLPIDQKAEILLKFPNQMLKTVPLTPDENDNWKGEYDTRGEQCGTIWGYITGVNHGRHFETSSGSSIAVTFPLGESCPECGHPITSNTYICPNCGTRLKVI